MLHILISYFGMRTRSHKNAIWYFITGSGFQREYATIWFVCKSMKFDSFFPFEFDWERKKKNVHYASDGWFPFGSVRFIPVTVIQEWTGGFFSLHNVLTRLVIFSDIFIHLRHHKMNCFRKQWEIKTKKEKKTWNNCSKGFHLISFFGGSCFGWRTPLLHIWFKIFVDKNILKFQTVSFSLYFVFLFLCMGIHWPMASCDVPPHII